jgi:4-amino-4-deoxy-L-arabinose transferase-like glycosyltransferase
MTGTRASSRRFWSILALVVLAAAGLRVAYVLTVTRHDTHFYDAQYYQFQAVSMAAGEGFFKDPFAKFNNPGMPAPPAAEHAPLTTLVLVPAAYVHGSLSDLLMRFTMVLIGLGSVVVLGLLGRELGGDTVGLVAAGIAALDPSLWMNDGLLMSESLSILLVSAILLCSYRVLRGGSLRWVLGLGACCGLLVLVRAELALLTPLIAVPAVWIGSRHSVHGDAHRVARVGGCVAVALVLVLPWVGFNLARFEKPTFVSTNDGLTMLAANCDRAYYGSSIGSGDINCRPPAPKGDASVANAADRTRALDYMGDHLGRWPLVVVARVARMWSVFHVSQTVGFDVSEGRPRWASYAGVLTLYVLVPLAMYGGYRMRRRKQRVWPLVVPIAVVTAMMLLIAGVPRYRAAAEPSIIALAAIGAVALVARGRGRDGDSPEPEVEVADRGLGSAAGHA